MTWDKRPDPTPVAQARLLNALRAAEGGLMTGVQLAEILYRDDPDGGALTAHGRDTSVVRTLILKLRRRGYPIMSRPGFGYFFSPTIWEFSDMNEPQGRQITRGKKTKATDYLPPGESVRIGRMIRSFEGQRNAAMSALAISEGQLAAKDFEIDALKRVIEELNVQREAAWAKPENMAGSETVVPG